MSGWHLRWRPSPQRSWRRLPVIDGTAGAKEFDGLKLALVWFSRAELYLMQGSRVVETWPSGEERAL